MFPFLKNRGKDDKDRRKKEKADKDTASRGGANTLTADELMRLEDAKIELEKKKSEEEGVPMTRPVKPVPRMDSASRKAPPVVQPKPKKGILKDKSNYGGHIPNQGVRGNLDDTVTLEENTLANEILSGLDESKPPDVKHIISSFDKFSSAGPPSSQKKSVPVKKIKSSSSVKPSPSKSSPTKSSVEPLSQKAPVMMSAPRPPSPTDKTYDEVDLQLPSVSTATTDPKAREIVVRRQAGGEFGFTLRKGAIIERGTQGISDRTKVVIFAEPGSSKFPDTGLLPGDRLVEINGTNVEEMTDRKSVV